MFFILADSSADSTLKPSGLNPPQVIMGIKKKINTFCKKNRPAITT
jgi:hypothetical protein